MHRCAFIDQHMHCVFPVHTVPHFVLTLCQKQTERTTFLPFPRQTKEMLRKAFCYKMCHHNHILVSQQANLQQKTAELNKKKNLFFSEADKQTALGLALMFYINVM